MKFLLLLFSIFCSAWAGKEGVKISDIPNPMIDPTRCGRPGVQKSIICDIDNILSKESKDVIEGRAMEIKDAEFGVCIISQMIPSSYTTSIDQSSKEFATTLHDTWGVGDKEKQNGVLIFLSVQDRAVYISRGSGLQHSLSDHILDLLIEHMKPYLRNNNYGDAIDAAIVEIDLIIHNKNGAIAKAAESDSEGYGGFFFFVIVFAGMIVYMWRQNTYERGLRAGHGALSRLMRDVESSADNRFEFTSCPICLEEFSPLPSADLSEDNEQGPVESSNATTPLSSPSSAVGDATSLLSPLRPMALHCGHTFCFKCLEEYLRDRNSDKKCPICRVPVDPSAPIPPRAPPAPPPPPSAGNRAPHSNSSRNSYGDNPSCGASAAPSYGGSTGHQTFRYQRNSPELLYRMNRMRFLYPAVMTAQLYSTMQQAAQNETPEALVRAARRRTDEVSRTLADIAKRNEAARRGSSGAGRSFGGGSSGGGRGGRW